MNKNYWKNIYKKNIVPNKGSNFSKFVLKYILKNKLKGKLIDVGCGNGRDAFYFFKKGLSVDGIDKHISTESVDPKIIKQNILTYDYSKYKLIYIRFVIHAINEKNLNKLLLKIKIKNAIIFIETRSTKGITLKSKIKLFFNSGIGSSHYRMLYSKEYLTKKISKNFKILYVNEKNTFSQYKSDKPYCIRYIITPNL
jgi:tellurite methyltransferase